MKIKENFVLKIQEREEAIQLLAMDPQVYGELLTHHQRVHGVDEEALRVRIPPPVGHQNMPHMGSCGDRSLRWRKITFDDLVIFSEVFWNIQEEDLGQRCPREPTSLGGAGPPWPHHEGLWGPCRHPALILRLPDLFLFQKKSFWQFHSVWTPFKILL